MSDEAGLVGALDQVVEAAVVLFGLSGAGLMFVDDKQVLRSLAASEGTARIFEAAQEEAGEGPCVDALVHDRVVHSSDLREDARWPNVAPRLVAHDVIAVLGVPVRVGGGAAGTMNVYVDRPHRWDESDITALTSYSLLIEQIVATAIEANRRDELVDRLQGTLDNRVTLERAVGFIMGRDGVDAVEAYNSLRRLSRERDLSVSVVAHSILTDGSGTR